MEQDARRRKRKRRPTLIPRFGPSSLALEIGLIRQAIQEESKNEEVAPKMNTEKK
ncbi:MAG: hypothetical protein PHC51_03465 [bacterium]|nr:hypothetical protein [bacterium]